MQDIKAYVEVSVRTAALLVTSSRGGPFFEVRDFPVFPSAMDNTSLYARFACFLDIDICSASSGVPWRLATLIASVVCRRIFEGGGPSLCDVGSPAVGCGFLELDGTLRSAAVAEAAVVGGSFE